MDLTNFKGFLDYPGLDYYDEKNKTWTEEKIAVETERAKTAESTLTTNLNNEISRAKKAEKNNATSINNEVTRATNAENTLATNLSSHTSNKSNPHGVTKAQVGLGNVDNTSDANKPISTATQTVLDAKAPLASPTLTGTPKAPTAKAGTNTTQIATTAFVTTAVANGIAASDAMIIKGTIGISGTITALPTTYKTGWTYRVVTAGTYAGQVCEIGDLIVALVDRSGSGNVDSDWCVAQTNINGAITGIKSGDAYISTSQSGSVVTITHKDVTRTNSTSTASPAHGGTFTAIKSITSDAKGHITAVDTETITLPSDSSTKNTAGSTNSSSKLFLIGATSQAANPQTYSHDTAYVGTDGHLYSNSKKVVNLSDSQALTNKTYNGYTLAAACAKGVDTTPTSGSTNLITSGGAYTALAKYVPLDGATMTGLLNLYQKVNVVDDAGVTKTVIQAFNPTPDSPSTYGSEILFGGGGNVFIGGGESYTSLRNALASEDTILDGESYGASSESVYLSADSNLWLYSNCNSVTSRKGICFNGSGVLFPITSNSYNLGASDRLWKNVYATTFNGNLTGDVTGNADTADALNTSAGDANTPVYFSGGKPVACTSLDLNTTGSAAKLTTARTIDGVSFNGSANITHFGTCSTAAATAAKTVACTGFTLATGASIKVQFTVTNTASSPTLNVNSTGAKSIMYRGSAITAGYLAANRVYEFVYDGKDWELIGDINTDNNTTYTTAVDFNTLTTTGFHHIKATGNTNAPTTSHGTVFVDFDIGTPYQIFTPDNVSNCDYKRNYKNNAWTEWTKREFTNTTYSNFVKSGSGAKAGLVPAPSTTAGTTKYLREDGTWQTPTNTTYSVATTSANGLMSSTDKTKLNNTNIAYGTCSTAAATAAKVITVSGNTNWVLKAGSMIAVKFTNTNTAENPTFNVNSTGAKSVWYNTAVITTSNLGYAGYANRIMNFIYDGTQYVFIGWSVDTDTNTKYTNASLGQGYGTCTTAANTTAKVVTLSSYALTTGGIISVKFTNAVPANATMNINSKGAKNIFYRGVKITAGVINASDIATFIYDGTQYQLISIDATTKKRNFILIGDSYLAGQTPDGDIDSWGIYLKKLLPEYSFSIHAIKGSGFGNTKSGKNFLDALNQYSGDKNSITDIIVCGGYNDAATSITTSAVLTGISNFINYVNQNFLNAKIHIGYVGASNNGTVLEQIKEAIRIYRASGSKGCGYISNMEYTLRNTQFFTSDGVHPNQIGQKNIAWNLASYLTTGNVSVIQEKENCNVTKPSTVTTGITLYTGLNNSTTSLYHPSNEYLKFSGLSATKMNGAEGSRVTLGTLTNSSIIGNQTTSSVATSTTNASVSIPVNVETASGWYTGIGTLEIISLNVVLRLNIMKNGAYLNEKVTGIIIPPFTATFDSLDV